MKKLFTKAFLGVLAAGISTVAFAQDAEISFKAEEIDYGNIQQGADGIRVFEFTNTGKASLVISNVTSSCGCTVPSWTNQPVAPGAKGKIEVKYDTNRVGPISKTITVTSNAKENPVKGLRIRGNVQQK